IKRGVLEGEAASGVAVVGQRQLDRLNGVTTELLVGAGQRPRGVQANDALVRGRDVLDSRVANDGGVATHGRSLWRCILCGSATGTQRRADDAGADAERERAHDEVTAVNRAGLQLLYQPGVTLIHGRSSTLKHSGPTACHASMRANAALHPPNPGNRSGHALPDP